MTSAISALARPAKNLSATSSRSRGASRRARARAPGERALGGRRRGGRSGSRARPPAGLALAPAQLVERGVAGDPEQPGARLAPARVVARRLRKARSKAGRSRPRPPSGRAAGRRRRRRRRRGSGGRAPRRRVGVRKVPHSAGANSSAPCPYYGATGDPSRPVSATFTPPAMSGWRWRRFGVRGGPTAAPIDSAVISTRRVRSGLGDGQSRRHQHDRFAEQRADDHASPARLERHPVADPQRRVVLAEVDARP